MVDKIEEIKKMVNGVIDKYKIFEGEFESVTYYWGGDYEEKTYRYGKGGNIICRVSENEIIGRLRWFLRTVYARFYVVNEHLKGYEKADNFLKFLGTSNPKESKKSSYLFRVEDVKCEKLEGEEKEKFDANIPSRVRLVLLKYKDESEKEYHYPLARVTFSLKIFNTVNENKDFLVVGGTVLTLAYLGIGKATSRGFGRFYLTRWESKSIKDKLSVLIAHVKKGEVEKAFSYFYSNSGFNLDNYNKWVKSAIPLAPLPCSDEDNEECIKIVPLNSQELLEVIKCVNNSTLKMYYKEELHKKSIDIHTWVFGFPRYVRETGYYIENEKGSKDPLRRISTVIITPVMRSTKANEGKYINEYDIAILPFLSLEDFREKIINLRHKGVGPIKKVIDVLLQESKKAQQSFTSKEIVKEAIEKVIKDYVNGLPDHIKNLYTRGRCKVREASTGKPKERKRLNRRR